MTSIFVRLTAADNKESAMHSAVRALNNGRATSEVFLVEPAGFAAVPGAPLAYWAAPSLVRAFGALGPFSRLGSCKLGASTKTDPRFVRCWWEISTILGGWRLHAKGGPYAPFYSDIFLAIRWGVRAEEIAASLEFKYPYLNNLDWVLHREHEYGWPGACWTRRTSKDLSVRALPAGVVFGDKGPAARVFTDDPIDHLAFIAVASSHAYRAALALQLAAAEAAARGYEVGLLDATCYPDLSDAERETLSTAARRAWSLKRSLDTIIETSHAFMLPALLQVTGSTLTMRAGAWAARVTTSAAELVGIQREIDDLAFHLYGIDGVDRARIEAESGVSPVAAPSPEDESSGGEDAEELEADDDEEDDTPAADAATLAAELLSWAIGVAFGRFDVRLATGEREPPPEPGPFDPLPARSPGMCPDDALAVDVLVDDEGHPDDLVQRVADVFTRVFGAEGEARLDEAVRLAGAPDLRTWLRRSFFAFHLKRYTKSRRKAPLWWPLSTTSGNYTLWVSWPRLTADTLFRLVSDQEPYVAQKIGQESRKLTSLKQDAGKAPTRAQSLAIAAQEHYVDEELTGLLDELTRVKPMWHPVHDDGVVLHAALLWRVFRDAGWQKECRERWEGLAGEKYEWAHIAMHLWPERVVPKCRKDRSLAIAHGLEGLFWIEDAGKWRPRETPDTEVRLASEALDFVWFRSAFRKLRAYANANATDPRWWSDLRDGLHDGEDVALALWPERVMKRCQEDERVAMRHQMAGLYRRKFTDRVKTGKRTWADELLTRFPEEMDRLTLAFDEAAGRFGSVGARDWPAFWRALDAGGLDDTTLARLVRPAEVAAHSREDAHIARIHGLLDRFWIDGRKRRTPDEETADAIRERSSPAVKDALRAFEQAPPPVRSGRGRKGSA